MRPFDVVVVPFPYSDRLSEKRRPALVVSNAELPELAGKVWVAMITSVPGELIGDAQIADLDAAGLPAASIVRASKVATLDADRVIRTVGRLSARDTEIARSALKTCAGF